jgi:histidinol phosphatase-like PHP family hydrolase
LHNTDLKEYFDSIDQIKIRYSDQIKVFRGIEIDSCPERCDFSKFPKWAYEHLDYILFEYINKKSANGLSLDNLINLRKEIPIPVGLAHTNISKVFNQIHPRLLVKILIENDIFIELTGGTRNIVYSEYHNKSDHSWKFYAPWIIQDAGPLGVKFSIGTDCHSSLKNVIMIDEAYNFLKSSGLLKNLIQL